MVLAHLTIASIALLGLVAREAFSREQQQVPPSGPITISKGGTYTGHWVSAGSTPPVRIVTTEPVTIKNAIVTNRGDAPLIDADVRGSNVTLDRVIANGGVGRFFAGEEVAALAIRRSEINKTGGIYILKAQPG